MIGYALRRLFTIPLVLLATFVLALALVRAAPQREQESSALTLDDCDSDAAFVPLLLRSLVRWIQLDVDPCTGTSHDGSAVLSLLAHAVMPTVTLAGGGLLMAVVLGAIGGALLSRGGFRARRFISFALAVLEVVPGFVVAPALLWFFGLTLRLAPAAHPEGVSVLLPVLALGITFAASHARAIRDVLLAPDAIAFRRATLARGTSAFAARMAALRLATLPVLGALGATSSAVFMSAIAVEIVFSIPGLGSLFVSAAERADVNVLFGAALCYACILLVSSAAFDLIYATIDPRVRSAR